MKRGTACFLVLAGSAAFAVQGAVSFERRYKDGEQDKYRVTVSLTIPGGSVDFSMLSVQTVKKAYENGDADIESAMSELKANFNGQEITPPAPPSRVARMSKYGIPVSLKAPGARRGSVNMQFLQLAGMLPDKAMKIGDTQAISYADPEDPKSVLTATTKLEAIESGVARLVFSQELSTPGAAKPLKITGTAWVEAATSKLNKVAGTVSNLPAGPGGAADAAQFTMERVK